MSVSNPASAQTLPGSTALGVSSGVLLVAGVLFIYTGMSKVVDTEAFARVIVSHNLVPSSLASVASFAVPICELLIGVAIAGALALKSRFVQVMAWIAAAMFLVFAGYTGLLWLQPPPKPSSCGCGLSARVVEDWGPLLLRNAVGTIALCACAGILGQSRAHGFQATTDKHV